jgi:hypothetical protein
VSVTIVDTNAVQQLLTTASGLSGKAGSARTKQIVHRILSDLFKTIEDLTSFPKWQGHCRRRSAAAAITNYSKRGGSPTQARRINSLSARVSGFRGFEYAFSVARSAACSIPASGIPISRKHCFTPIP